MLKPGDVVIDESSCACPDRWYTQGDAEDSIRTNAIIFLGKVAAQLKPSVRDKILLPAFARGVKDPFVATRLAGLRATAACHQHFQAEEVRPGRPLALWRTVSPGTFLPGGERALR